jgi:hypothetical protein
MNAEAISRIAKAYAAMSPERRAAEFTPGVLYTAPLPETETGAGAGSRQDSAASSGPRPIGARRVPADCAESLYGTLLPASILPGPETESAHVLHHDTRGNPVTLDGTDLDQNPRSRLATRAQRTALAYRDRHCQHPGCTRPPTWTLHAHHKTPHSKQGPTTMQNLTLLCSQHHTLDHSLQDPAADPAA